MDKLRKKYKKTYKRYRRSYKTAKLTLKGWLALTLICGAGGYLVCNDFYIPQLISEVTNVPKSIVKDGLEHNAIAVYLFGTYEERHSFAKGQPTGFGSMPYDVDEVMKRFHNMSEERVHNIGSLLGFCNQSKKHGGY